MLPTSTPELRRRSTTTTAAASPAVAARASDGNLLLTGEQRQDPWSPHVVVVGSRATPSRPSFSTGGSAQKQSHDSIRLATAMKTGSTLTSSRLAFIRQPRFQALLCLCLTVVPWIYHSSQTQKIHSIHRALKRLLRDHKQLLASLERSQLELEQAQTLAQEIELDNRELVDALAAAATHGSFQEEEDGSMHVGEDGNMVHSGPNVNMYQEAQHLEDLYLERIGIIEAAIRNHSLQHIRQVYKPRVGGGTGDAANDDGPMYVEIRLSAEVDHETNQKSRNGAAGTKDSSRYHSILILETAPIHVAPHAIDHFLRLVESKYYDGRTFALLHQPTLLSARAPSNPTVPQQQQLPPYAHRIHTVERQGKPNVGSLPEPKSVTIKDGDDGATSKTLLSMAFTDHHRGQYPLQKYSVLFHGKPGGGPHFSIHMMDPQKQQRSRRDGHIDEEDDVDAWERDDTADDACFARIVRGHDVLDRMVQMSQSTQSQQRVVIERATITRRPTGLA